MARTRWAGQFAVAVVTILAAPCLGDGATVPANVDAGGAKIVKSTCIQCHRIEGRPAPRRTKKAPDLIWAGNKYQRHWLVA
jgi:mono/diheme cytochrome c family protein